MKNQKLVALAFAIIAVSAAIFVGNEQYGAIRDGERYMTAYAATRLNTPIFDDGGENGGNNGGGGGGSPVTSVTISRIGAGSTDTDPGYVTANGTRVLTRLEFRVANAEANIKRIQFGASVSSSVPLGSGLDDEIASVSLRRCADVSCSTKSDITGLTNLPIITSGADAGTVIAYNASGFFTIPRGESRYFTLEANLNPIQIGSSAQADSGTKLYALVRSSNFLASGNGNTTTFTTSTGGTNYGVTGMQKVILRSHPTLSVAKPAGSVLANGINSIIDITAGVSDNPMALKTLGINIATTGAILSAPTPFNVTVTELNSNTSVIIGNTTTRVATSSSDLYIAFVNPEIITPGSPKTYRVKVTFQNVTSTAGAARATAMLDRNEFVHIDSVTANSLASSTSWIWSDLSDDQVGNESLWQWANGFYIRPFPTTSFTITN